MLVNPKVIERYAWVVSYKEPDDSESTITVFDDETEARKCFNAFKTKIGNILKDKWFDIDKFFKEKQVD